MADQGFNKIFILIGICIYIQLDVVLLQTTTGSSEDRTYFEMNSAGDLAVQMKYFGGTSLDITVFYEALSDSAKQFFEKQITSKLHQDATKCLEISFRFGPCSILKGNTPSEADMTQLCVAKALLFDRVRLGNFVTCYSAGKEKDACLNQIQMDTEMVHDCVANGAVSDNWHNCNNSFLQAKEAKGEQFKAIEDFKNALCGVLKSGTLKCPSVCGE